MTRPYTLSRPAMQRVSQLCRKCGEFAAVFRLYKRANHSAIYSAKIAWGIAFRGIPF